jgi:hypothetical protein
VRMWKSGTARIGPGTSVPRYQGTHEPDHNGAGIKCECGQATMVPESLYLGTFVPSTRVHDGNYVLPHMVVHSC